MRDIKFRVWNEEFKSFDTLLKDDYYGDGNIGFVDSFVGNEEDIWEQFTGLHDKNGTEIYEGDVVEIIVEHNVYYPSKDAPKFTPIKKVCPVKIRPGIMTVGKWILCEFKPDKIRVIGNIHENPELLERK